MPPHRHKASMVPSAWFAPHGLTKIPYATAGYGLPDDTPCRDSPLNLEGCPTNAGVARSHLSEALGSKLGETHHSMFQFLRRIGQRSFPSQWR